MKTLALSLVGLFAVACGDDSAWSGSHDAAPAAVTVVEVSSPCPDAGAPPAVDATPAPAPFLPAYCLPGYEMIRGFCYAPNGANYYPSCAQGYQLNVISMVCELVVAK